MIEHATMRVLHAPTLGWRNVDVRDLLASAIGLPVQIENSGRACALAQLWAMHGGTSTSAGDFVFVSVSDGLGLGVIVRGELLRGRHNVAGEFGHVPLDDGRTALLVRRHRVLGSVCVQPRDAGSLLRAAGGVG